MQNDEADAFCSQSDYNEADSDYEEFNSVISTSEVRGNTHFETEQGCG